VWTDGRFGRPHTAHHDPVMRSTGSDSDSSRDEATCGGVALIARAPTAALRTGGQERRGHASRATLIGPFFGFRVGFSESVSASTRLSPLPHRLRKQLPHKCLVGHLYVGSLRHRHSFDALIDCMFPNVLPHGRPLPSDAGARAIRSPNRLAVHTEHAMGPSLVSGPAV
jgi:hypothetical protein